MIKAAILAAALGAIFASIADVLMIGRPVSGHELEHLGLEAMKDMPYYRLLLGGALGVIGFFCQAIGFYAVYRGLDRATKWLSYPCLILFILALFLGTAWHFSYPFIGSALNYGADAGVSATAEFSKFYQELTAYLVFASTGWRLAIVAASILLVVTVVAQPTRFPKWYVAFTPYLLIYLFGKLTLLVPAPVGGLFFVSQINIAMLIFFMATGAVLWRTT